MIPRDPDQVLTLIGAIVVVAEAVVVVYLRPHLGAWMLAVAAVLGTYSQPREIVIGTFQVYLLDVVTVVLGGVVVLRLIQRPSLERPLVGLLTLLGLALARGASKFEAESAVNAARGLMPFVVALAFACVCLRQNTWHTVQRIWYAAAGVFLLSAVVFTIRNGLDTYATSGDRALNAAQALVVGQAGIMALVSHGSQRLKLFSAACFVILLASQQRTVWGATLATAAVVGMRSGHLASRQVARSLRLGLLAASVGLVILLTAGPSALQRSVTEATSTASTESGTLGWRVDGWISLLNNYWTKPAEDKLLGQPFGTGFDRTIDDQLITVSPHNMYLTVLFSLGAIGLLSLSLILISAFRHAARSSQPLLALQVGLLVFSLGYQLFSIQGLLIGAALTYPLEERPATPATSPTRHVQQRALSQIAV